MNAQRWFALLLIGLEAAAFSSMFESTLLPAIACAIACAGVWGKVQIPLSKDRMQLAALALAAVFGFKFVLFPAESLTRTTIFMDFNFGHTVGLFFLYLQACLFFIRWKGNALPSANILFSAMVLILCGRVVSDESMNRSYLMFVWGYIALTALFIASRPRGEAPSRRAMRPLAIVLLTGIVLLSFVGSLGMSLGLEAVEDDLMSLVGQAMAHAHASIGPGFSSTAHLGSLARIQSSERDRVSLRIYCDGTPGYLRGRSYVNYDKNSWTCDTGEGSTLFPSTDDSTLAGLKNDWGNVFQLHAPGQDKPKRLEVWSELKKEETIFAPLGSYALAADVPQIEQDSTGVPRWNKESIASDYCLLEQKPFTNTALSTWEQALYTQVPENLDPAIRALGARLFQGCPDTATKIAAVEDYFTRNYEYHFGIQIPEGKDPLAYFLLERPPAHCEYFASGAAILLRLAEVPCRYINGFLPSERNPYGNYWVARNRDAHAWVEAFDETHGWTIVEATPPAGLPETRRAGSLGYLWDWLRQGWKQFRTAFSRIDWATGVEWLKGGFVFMLTSIWGWIMVVICSAGYFLHRRRRRTGTRPKDPALRRMHRLLEYMDRRVRRSGLVRAPGETLHQFARRIAEVESSRLPEEIPAWYREYARLRYAVRPSREELKNLEEASLRMK
jgi:hypothetical protein